MGKVIKRKNLKENKNGSTSNKSNFKNKIKTNNKIGTTSKIEKIRLNYTPEALNRAIKAVAAGISVRKAAESFGVPSTTIFRKYKNPNKKDSKMGPPTILTEEEEKEIVHWILYRAQRGCPVTKSDVLDSVQKYITSVNKLNPFKENRPGRHWWEGFCNRHPNLSVRTAQHLTTVRASVSEHNLRAWFSEIKKHLESKDLLSISPSRVFNCDETNIQLCPKPEKVLVKRGARNVYKVVDANEKESITTLFMYSADGVRAPPLLLFPYKESVPKKIIQHVPKGWGVGISDKGWMTSETFYEYITNVFYRWLKEQNIEFPVIIYVDGHSSHITLPLVKFCRENNLELIALYPNSTHIMQPLDVAFFHPFKEIWKKIVPKWKIENNVMRLNKEQFPAVLQIALDYIKEEKKIIQNGFKSCGLMPFNPNAVEYDILNKKSKNAANNVEKNIHEPLINQQFFSDKTIEDKQNYLAMFENSLSPQLLKEFQDSEFIKNWIGDSDKSALFKYWIEVKKEVHEIKNKPVIKDIQNLDTKIVILRTDCASLNEDTITPGRILASYSNPVVNSISSNVVLNDLNIMQTIDLGNLEDTDIIISPLNSSTNEIVNITNDINNELYNRQDEETKTACINEENNIISCENQNSRSLPEIDNINAYMQNSNENKENDIPVSTEGTNKPTCFSKAFIFPDNYLPKQKQMKKRATKKRLPSAATSDEWWQEHLNKEEEQRKKAEKIANTKKMQETRKKLIQDKKNIENQLKEMQKKIKQEK